MHSCSCWLSAESLAKEKERLALREREAMQVRGNDNSSGRLHLSRTYCDFLCSYSWRGGGWWLGLAAHCAYPSIYYFSQEVKALEDRLLQEELQHRVMQDRVALSGLAQDNQPYVV